MTPHYEYQEATRKLDNAAFVLATTVSVWEANGMLEVTDTVLQRDLAAFREARDLWKAEARRAGFVAGDPE